VADLYEILEVPRDATTDDIKRAYRRLARASHPDANPDDPDAEARFKELAAAYEVLSDPEKRDRYDRFGSSDGFDLGDPFGSGAGGLGDLFDAFFTSGGPFGGGGRTRGPSGPPRGPDLEVTATLGFTDAVFGEQTDVTVRTALRCEDCDSTGAAPGTEPVVLHSWALVYLSPADRVRFVELLVAASTGGSLTWISIEAPGVAPGVVAPAVAPDAPARERYATVVALTRFEGGARTDLVLARCHPHLSWIEWRDPASGRRA